MKPFIALGLVAVTLAACTEQDMCINRATQQVSAAERQIRTLEGNIARGYALHSTMERITYEDVCYKQREGKKPKPYPCTKSKFERVERPVSIDVADQRRQLRALKLQLPNLRRTAAETATQCKADYPES